MQGEISASTPRSRARSQELAALRGQIPADAPAEFDGFLNLHRMILDDSSLSQAPRELIRERRTNAEWALAQQMEALLEQFEEIEDQYLRERRRTSSRWSSGCSRRWPAPGAAPSRCPRPRTT